jgi:hypothetical protein
MKRMLFLLLLMPLLSCKQDKVTSPRKLGYVNVDDAGNADEKKVIPNEVEEIGTLYQPERMEQEEIKKKEGKNDYQFTLTNSDILDKDLKNIHRHARKIVRNYYQFLVKINVPFCYNRILVQINHRNGKKDLFSFSEKELQELLKP